MLDRRAHAVVAPVVVFRQAAARRAGVEGGAGAPVLGHDHATQVVQAIARGGVVADRERPAFFPSLLSEGLDVFVRELPEGVGGVQQHHRRRGQQREAKHPACRGARN